MNGQIRTWLQQRMEHSQARYGPFASTHEALGVASEEWDELREAIKKNDLDVIQHECLDLAAVLLRLAESIDTSPALQARSVK